MKYICHVPVEQYGFVSAEWDTEELIVAPVDVYRDIAAQFKPKEGLTTKEFNDALDNYLLGKGGDTEQYAMMSDSQKACFQEVKKSIARIKSKQKV